MFKKYFSSIVDITLLEAPYLEMGGNTRGIKSASDKIVNKIFVNCY